MIISITTILTMLFFNCSSEKNNTMVSSDPTDSIPGGELVWNDEFEGPEIDLTKWEHEVNGQGSRNNELKYYNPMNLILITTLGK